MYATRVVAGSDGYAAASHGDAGAEVRSCALSCVYAELHTEAECGNYTNTQADGEASSLAHAGAGTDTYINTNTNTNCDTHAGSYTNTQADGHSGTDDDASSIAHASAGIGTHTDAGCASYANSDSEDDSVAAKPHCGSGRWRAAGSE